MVLDLWVIHAKGPRHVVDLMVGKFDPPAIETQQHCRGSWLSGHSSAEFRDAAGACESFPTEA